MEHKRAIVVFVCSLSLPAAASADDFGNMFGVMFRMMLTMANIMSSAMDNSNSWNSGGSPFNSFNSLGSGWNSWPAMGSLAGLGGMSGMNPWSGMGGWPGTGIGGWPGTGGSPWSLPMGGSPWGAPVPGGFNPATLSVLGGYPLAGGGYGLPVNPSWPRGWSRNPGGPYGASLLDGKWYGNTGEVLEVRGNRFHLRSGQYAVKGTLGINNNVVRMFIPKTGSTQIYSFVRNQSSLILQDTSGQVLVFQQNPYSGMVHVF